MCQLLRQPSLHPCLLRWMGMSGDVVVGHDNNKISQTTRVVWLNCCLVVQLFGCLVVWLFSCFVVQLFSYFVVQLFSCLVILLFSYFVVQLFCCFVVWLFLSAMESNSINQTIRQQDNKTTRPQWRRIVSTKQPNNQTTKPLLYSIGIWMMLSQRLGSS